MGSYCTLKLGNYEIATAKSYIDAYWACFFNESDRRVVRVKYDEHYTEPIEDEGEGVDQHEYAADVKTVKLRLGVMGFTLERTEETFANGIQKVLDARTDFYNNADIGDFSIELAHIKTLKDNGFEG